MDAFSQADVESLLAHDSKWCVSMFLPTHRTGADMQQDPIRLKNLLREADAQLRAAGVRTPDAAEMLKPGHALLENGEFWKYQSDGLALFFAADHFSKYRVPLRLDERIIVAQRFQLKPLFPFLTGDGHFFILALSQNEIRLLEGTRHAVDELEPENLPANFREAVRLDDQQRQLQFHTGGADRGGQRGGVIHGHGPGDEAHKEMLAKYFRQIDNALCALLKQDGAPLVLAGVDYYFPIYRSVSRYPRLLEAGVAGNPETLRPDQLHDRAWPLVEPEFRKDRDDALARFAQRSGTGLNSNNILEILPAAYQGRVETVFVATDKTLWGTFDAATQELVQHQISDPHNEDLLDRAAIAAYSRGGVVYAMPAAEVPGGESIAAVYRY